MCCTTGKTFQFANETVISFGILKLFCVFQALSNSCLYYHVKFVKDKSGVRMIDSLKQNLNSPFTRGGGGVHNMLRVRVCAAHMGGFLGPKFSKQGSLFRQFFHKQGWVIQKLAKNSKKWVVFRQNSS